MAPSTPQPADPTANPDWPTWRKLIAEEIRAETPELTADEAEFRAARLANEAWQAKANTDRRNELRIGEICRENDLEGDLFVGTAPAVTLREGPRRRGRHADGHFGGDRRSDLGPPQIARRKPPGPHTMPPGRQISVTRLLFRFFRLCPIVWNVPPTDVAAPPSSGDPLTLIRTAAESGAVVEVVSGGEGAELSDRAVGKLVAILEHFARGEDFVLTSTATPLTTGQVADMLGVSRPTVVSMIDRGELEAVAIGSHRRVFVSTVLSYIEGHRMSTRGKLDELTQLSQKYGYYDD